MAKSKAKFVAAAPSLEITINGNKYAASAREFKTGSVGYYFDSKIQIKMPDGTIEDAKVAANVIVQKSKDWEA